MHTTELRGTRRNFLKAGAWAGLAFLGGAGLGRQARAGDAKGAKKMLFIFQRGGSDGVNTLIPRGDPEYSLAARPTLFVPEDTALDLGNGFAQLHPAMQPMLELYHSVALTGTPGPGNLAVLHRIGYAGHSQSHFDSQKFWENGVPGAPALDEGMIYRHVAATMHPTDNRLAAASLAGTQLVALRGPIPLPTFRTAEGFTFAGGDAKVAKLLGALPTVPQGADGAGLLGLYGGVRDGAGKPYRDLVYGTGLALADSMRVVKDAVAQGAYVPANNASYPSDSLGATLQNAAMLMKRTPIQVVGCNVGGWDTHINQGQVGGTHGKLLASVAQGYQALFRDLQDQWQDLLVVTMTEFGRTSRENGSKGTDHGLACVMFVGGGAVRGGVYNCNAATWVAGDLFSSQERYIRYRTDYRAVFAEIFQRHFGASPGLLEQVIPGYGAAAAARPAEFTPLGFLPA